MGNLSLEQMRAERDRLDAEIRAAEEKAALEHNKRMTDLGYALRGFVARDGGWPIRDQRRKNVEVLEIGFPGHIVTTELHFDEPGYPVGSTVVSVMDRPSGVTATFDGAPSNDVLVSLVKAWLTSDFSEGKA